MSRVVARISSSPKLQMWKRQIEMKSWKFRGLRNALPVTNCVDVGASYYPHTSWWLFLGVSNSNWVAVEPNEKNLTYLQHWPWKSKSCAVVSGLSEVGGKQVLHLTNIDSGSSLLEPVIPNSMKHRLGKAGETYFFPVTKIDIDTRTLHSVITEMGDYPTVVKLDTQGSELSILRSAVNESTTTRIVGIEIECSLLSDPLYKDSPRLWEVALYLERFGFELIGLDVLPRRSTSKKISSSPKLLVHECDAIFARKRDFLQEDSVESRAALLAFYVTNNFYQEAVLCLQSDAPLCEFLKGRGLRVERLLTTLRQMMR
jgi:FkbM family methyltransferase